VNAAGDNGAALSFEHDIKPLFREGDRDAMLFLFDLWALADVRRHANRILPAVRAGVMPCDGQWSDEQVALLEHWIDTGTPR
jgi:hypothetical protein